MALTSKHSSLSTSPFLWSTVWLHWAHFNGIKTVTLMVRLNEAEIDSDHSDFHRKEWLSTIMLRSRITLILTRKWPPVWVVAHGNEVTKRFCVIFLKNETTPKSSQILLSYQSAKFPNIYMRRKNLSSRPPPKSNCTNFNCQRMTDHQNS